MKKLTIILSIIAMSGMVFGESVPEPMTTFYGKITNGSGGTTRVLTEGDLSWRIRVGDGAVIEAKTELEPVAAGRYSYRIGVPIPLNIAESEHEHLMITLDGKDAAILSPGTETFRLSQVKRATNFRLDLTVSVPETDTDGDGLPDWWEEKYGLNPNSNSDAEIDTDGDGWNSSQEFANGTDPNSDDRVPGLLTSELLFFPDKNNGIYLHVTDSDTPPDSITITTSPTIFNESTFTLADIKAGKILYNGDSNTSFSVILSDGEHESDEQTVTLRRDDSRQPDGDLIWDFHGSGVKLDASTHEVAQWFYQNASDADLIAGAGRDWFAFSRESLTKIAAFEMGSDVIDFKALAGDRTGNLRDYVTYVDNRIEFENTSVELTGIETSLRELYSTGSLRAGSLHLLTEIRLTATDSEARENGPSSGIFTISRSEPADTPLTVHLALNGSATNGVDYSWVPESVIIPAGETTASVVISPYSDGLTEPGEVVELAVLQNENYEIGEAATAQMTIVDLAPEITLEALVPLAKRETGSPGLLLLQRTGVVDRSVLVRLEFSGTAENGSDYDFVLPFIQLAPNETTRMISILPTETSDEPESVIVRLLKNPDYLNGDIDEAEIFLIDRTTTFDGDSLAEYALPALPAARKVEGAFEFRFRRNPAATDVSYRVEISTDLKTWRPMPQEATVGIGESTVAERIYRLPSTAGQNYGRIRLELIP